mgnify:CR=1 FL=1
MLLSPCNRKIRLRRLQTAKDRRGETQLHLINAIPMPYLEQKLLTMSTDGEWNHTNATDYEKDRRGETQLYSEIQQRSPPELLDHLQIAKRSFHIHSTPEYSTITLWRPLTRSTLPTQPTSSSQMRPKLNFSIQASSPR